MMNPEIQADLRRGDSVKIGLVKDNVTKNSRPVGGKMYQQNKNGWAKFLLLTQSKGKKMYDLFMKDVDEFILD